MKTSNKIIANAIAARVGNSKNPIVKNALRVANYGDIDYKSKDPLEKWKETPEWKRAIADRSSGDMIAKMERLLTGTRLARFKSDFDAHLRRGYKRLDKRLSFNFRDKGLEGIFTKARAEFAKPVQIKPHFSAPRISGDWPKVKTELVQEFMRQFKENTRPQSQTVAKLLYILQKDGVKLATFYTPGGQMSRITAALKNLNSKLSEWNRKAAQDGRDKALNPLILAAWEEINKLKPIAEPRHMAAKKQQRAERVGASYGRDIVDWYDRLDARGGYSGD